MGALVNNKFGGIAFLVCLFILYVIFPSITHSGDAWGYAGDVRFGNNLFHPHHLGYTITNCLIYHGLYNIGMRPDAMKMMIVVNAFAATLCIYALYKVLALLGPDNEKKLFFAGIAAFSFGFMRFATEAEAYIIPLLFSLLASYYFIKTLQNNNSKVSTNLFLSGLAGAIACFYHQIHIFWWLGLLTGVIFLSTTRRIKYATIFSAPFIMVPIAYCLVLRFYYQQEISIPNLFHLVLHDLYTGQIDTHIGLHHFILGGINLLRTFYQVHGLVIFLLKKYIWLWIAAISSISLLIFFLISAGKRIKSIKPLNKDIALVFLLIAIIQFLFAVFNGGNAEFMVMLPALAAIIANCYTWIPVNGLKAFVISMFIWNFCFAILPCHYLTTGSEEKLALKVLQKRNTLFILENRGVVLNIDYYLSGNYPQNTYTSPAYYKISSGNTDSVKLKIQECELKRIEIITDCYGNTSLMSRAALIEKNYNDLFFKDFHLKKLDSVSTTSGWHYLWQIQ